VRHPGNDVSGWAFGKRQRPLGDPDGWDLKPLGPGRKTKSVIKILRNGLAHGNIYTRGNPIKEVVLLSSIGDTDKFDICAVTVSGLAEFLDNWIDFLASLPLSSDPVSGELFGDAV